MDAETKPRAAKARTMRVRALKGFFPKEGPKVLKGDVADIPLAEAKRFIECKAAERADALPWEGEDGEPSAS